MDCPRDLTELTILDQAWRSISNKRSTSNAYASKCDQNTNLGESPMSGHSLSDALWYRFAGDAGDRMQSTAPGYQRCGTDRTGWLATPHPPLGSAPRESRVCFHYSTSNYCYQSIIIKACACSYDGGATTTYMYKLPQPPDCNAAYCGTTAPAPPNPPPPSRETQLTKRGGPGFVRSA